MIKETTEYDNFIGKTEVVTTKNVFEICGDPEDEVVVSKNAWQNHWKGMPEYIQEDNPPYKKVIISFRNKEDYDEFAKLITDQKLTDKTKSIWYPALDRDANSLLRWVEEEE